MFKQHVQDTVEAHYNHLVNLGYDVVGVFLYGSQNYQLDYEQSDVDTKAIILPPLEDIIMGYAPESKSITMEDGGLCDVKDIRLFFRQIKSQNINFIETLFTDYYKLNPNYEYLYLPMFEKREDIARLNEFLSISCIYGMANEKSKHLLTYPAEDASLGYNRKRLYQLYRLRDFLLRYCCKEKYEDILIPREKNLLFQIKTESPYTKEEALTLTEAILKDMRLVYLINKPSCLPENKET